MNIALVHKHYNKDHLEAVKKEMVVLGAPKIKAIWMECYGHFAALEGCHRIRAAKDLGLTPEIIELDYDDVAELDLTDESLGLDLDNPGSTVAWLIDDSHKSAIIEFDE